MCGSLLFSPARLQSCKYAYPLVAGPTHAFRPGSRREEVTSASIQGCTTRGRGCAYTRGDRAKKLLPLAGIQAPPSQHGKSARIRWLRRDARDPRKPRAGRIDPHVTLVHECATIFKSSDRHTVVSLLVEVHERRNEFDSRHSQHGITWRSEKWAVLSSGACTRMRWVFPLLSMRKLV